MNKYIRTAVSVIQSVFFSIMLISTAGAQTMYPTRSPKIIVPYPPGGTTDMLVRLYSQRLSRELGQSVVVDNRPGGGTNIAADIVANSSPDGYTLLSGTLAQVMNPVFGPYPSFDLLSKLTPIATIAEVPYVLAANPNRPFHTAKELIAAAKASPGKFTVSSAQLELWIEILKDQANIDILHIPYKGGAAATSDALSGQVDMVFAALPVLLPHIKAGKLVALGVTGKMRASQLPNISSFVEINVDYVITNWFGLFSPKGIEASVVNKLVQATDKILRDPETVTNIRELGAEPLRVESDKTFQNQIIRDTDYWRQIALKFPQLVQPK